MRRFTTLIVPALAAALALSACGGVDRAGTRDQIVKSIEAAGGTVDSECIDSALDKYSDDELKSIDDALSKGDSQGADTAALLEELMSCMSLSS